MKTQNKPQQSQEEKPYLPNLGKEAAEKLVGFVETHRVINVHTYNDPLLYCELAVSLKNMAPVKGGVLFGDLEFAKDPYANRFIGMVINPFKPIAVAFAIKGVYQVILYVPDEKGRPA